MNKIYASILFTVAKAEYKGNNVHFGEIIEKMDKLSMEVQSLMTTDQGKNIKIVCDVSLECDRERDPISDSDEAGAMINDRLHTETLPSFFIVMDDDQSEYASKPNDLASA